MNRIFRLTTAKALATAGMVFASPLAWAGSGAAQAMAAGGPPSVTVLTTDVGAPEQIAVHEGKVYIGDAVRSTVTKIGYPTPLAVGPDPGEITGVDVKPDSFALAYAAMDATTGQGTVTVRRRGHSPVVADLTRFEQQKNPDGSVFYGSRTTDPCVRDALARLPLPTPRPAGYTGRPEAHPYAVAAGAGDDWYVVDASANDLLRIDGAGAVSLVAVLPGQPHTFTEHDARALGLPDCIVGVRYVFESAPTDVEVGADGALYVTTLPGGPIGLQLGARGSVYRVDPKTGYARTVVTGLAGAVNLALGPDGRIYVAELFGGRISVAPGHPRRSKASTAKPVLRLKDVVGLEFDGSALYASTLPPNYLKGDTSGHGSVVKIAL